MSGQYTVYFREDEEELKEWVEESEDVFGGASNLFKRAVRLMRKEHGNSIEDLKEDTGLDDFT